MSYLEALRRLSSLVNYEQKSNYPYLDSFELERMTGFLRLLGEPQKDLKCLHIAGSKGKGSTCMFAAYILRRAGFRVGVYTSPHLIDFRERIRVLGQGTGDSLPAGKAGGQGTEFEGMISKRGLAGLVNRVKLYVEDYNRNLKNDSLTFFEVYTAIAFLYFKEKKVDFAVLETGLGGRLDATNTVNSLVCAITPISYEHTDKLGNTLKEIAVEKAGIIKSRRPQAAGRRLIVITAPQEKEALQVIRERCRQVKARLFEIGKDIVYRKTKHGFSIKGIFGRYDNLKIRLLGEHQLVNAVTAVGLIEALRFFGVKIDPDPIRKGLKEALWPGRCEVVLKKPLVVLDGAQNSASVKALKEAVKNNFKYKKLILILGISSDKDIPGICRQLNNWANEVILARANTSRAENPEALAQYFQTRTLSRALAVSCTLAAICTSGVPEALQLALKKAEAKDLILVTGSLFVVGEARDCLTRILRCKK